MEQQGDTQSIRGYEMPNDFAREQSSSFRTSFLGFDKEDVIGYIDRLVRDISDQRGSLEVSMTRLTDQNRNLIERINRYEQQIHALKLELDEERQYNQNAHEREELFKRAVAVLQEKVAFLQNNAAATNGESDAYYEEQVQRANEIVIRLREEILRKEETISKLSEELSRRNDIILNQDRILSAKDNQIGSHVRALEEAKRQVSARIEEAQKMNEQIEVLKNRISLLEEKRVEALNEMNEALTRLRGAQAKQQDDRQEIERMRQQQKEDWNTLEQLRAKRISERQELSQFREQIQRQSEQIARMQLQHAEEQKAAANKPQERDAAAEGAGRRVYENEMDQRARPAAQYGRPAYPQRYFDNREIPPQYDNYGEGGAGYRRRYEMYDLPEIEQGLYQREQKERPYYHEEYQRDRYIDQYYRLPEPVSYYRSGEGRRYRVPDSREVPYYYDDYFLSGRDPAADRINNGYPPYPPYRY